MSQYMLYSVCIYLSLYYKVPLKTLNVNSKYDVFGCIIFYLHIWCIWLHNILIIISNNIFKVFSKCWWTDSFQMFIINADYNDINLLVWITFDMSLTDSLGRGYRNKGFIEHYSLICLLKYFSTNSFREGYGNLYTNLPHYFWLF